MTFTSFLSIFSIFVFFGVSATAQNIDMSTLTPTLTYPEPKPDPGIVAQGKIAINK